MVGFLNREVLTDVEFLLRMEHDPAPMTIRAHRQILAMRNVKFFELLFVQHPEEMRFAVEGLHPDGFNGLVRYLYSGVLDPNSFEEVMYTREAAKRYEAPDLISACSNYIEKHLTTGRVCPLLDCLNTRDVGLVDKAVIAMLKTKGSSVLQSDTFLDSSDTTVHFILDVVASVPESLVASSLRRWAEAKREKVLYAGGSPLQLGKVMRPFFPQLRLLALTPEEYINGPGSWGILTDRENRVILHNIVDAKSVPLPRWVNRNYNARSIFERHYRYDVREPVDKSGSRISSM